MDKNEFIIDGLKKLSDTIKHGGRLDMAGKVADMSEALLAIMYDTINAPIGVKIKRTTDAKMFPLLRIGKRGDTGYDLPSVYPYRKEYIIDHELGLLDTDLIERDRAIIRSEVAPKMPNAKPEEIEMEVEAYLRESVTIYPGERILVPTGISLELPYGSWALITARSSTSKKKLLVPQGIIDEGYRGELFAQLINVGDQPVDIRHGERYVQLIIFNRLSDRITFTEVDKLAESERGDTGFGSTGQSAVVDKCPCENVVFSDTAESIEDNLAAEIADADYREFMEINNNADEID